MRSCNKNTKPHKRIYHYGKKKPRRKSRRFCPECGAVLAPGRECKCLYMIPADNDR